MEVGKRNKLLRQEIADLQGGIREAFRLLERFKLAQAKSELARFLTQEELAALKVKREPCP